MLLKMNSSKNLLFIILFCYIGQSFGSRSTSKFDYASYTSKSLIIKQQIPIDEFGISNKNATTIVVCNFKPETLMPFKFQLIQEASDSTYFITSIDHRLDLTLNFNYKLKSKRVMKRIDIEIKKSNLDYIHRLKMVFISVDVSDFLLKERALLTYFRKQLNNPNAIIVSIEKYQKWLYVIIGNPTDFTFSTYQIVNETCPYIDDKLYDTDDRLKNTFIGNFFKFYGIELEECAMSIYTLNLLPVRYKPKNEVNLSIVLCDDGILDDKCTKSSSSSKQTINSYLLILALIFFFTFYIEI